MPNPLWTTVCTGSVAMLSINAVSMLIMQAHHHAPFLDAQSPDGHIHDIGSDDPYMGVLQASITHATHNPFSQRLREWMRLIQ